MNVDWQSIKFLLEIITLQILIISFALSLLVVLF